MAPIRRIASCLLLWSLFSLSTLSPVILAQDLITRIHFEGLKQTKTRFLYQFLTSKPGHPPDSAHIARDIQALKNLQLFSTVDARVEDHANGKEVIFEVRERISRLPIINFGGISDNFWFQLGGVEFNGLGQGAILGGYYQYYDRHSFKVFYNIPFLFSEKWGLGGSVGKMATEEPAFFQSANQQYAVDRWEAIATGRFQVARNRARFSQVFLEAGGGFLNETYTRLDRFSPPLRFDKLLLKLQGSYEAVSFDAERLKGTRHMMQLQTVRTFGESSHFYQVLYTSMFFGWLGSSGNPSVRLRAGVATNRDSPFVPFVLDSYLNVRGSGNRVARGTAELTINAEHRQTITRKGWGAIQLVGFLDISAWRPAGSDLATMFESPNVVTFTGGGLRMQSWRIYNFIIRLDYGIGISDYRSRGFVLGVGQYF